MDFATTFATTAEFDAPQEGTGSVIRLGGAGFLGDSLVAVADPSEAHVVVFGLPSGDVRYVVGRSGNGPGEFARPSEPRFDHEGRLHVLDPSLRRIQVFQRDSVLRVIGLADRMATPFDYDLLEGGGYVISGTLLGEGLQRGVLHLDQEGAVVRSIPVPLPDRPAGAVESPLWATLSRVNVIAHEGQAWVTRPMLDSAWVITLATGAVSAVAVPAPDYVVPAVPATPPQTREEAAGWWRTWLLPHTVLHTGDALLVGFSRGVYYDGAPGVLMMQTPNGGWNALTGAPPIIGAGGGLLLGSTNGDSLPVHLVVYAAR